MQSPETPCASAVLLLLEARTGQTRIFALEPMIEGFALFDTSKSESETGVDFTESIVFDLLEIVLNNGA